jgi:hypothetical protein
MNHSTALAYADRLPAEFRAALVFVGTALLLRSPALLYSVTNFDESLYLLIGEQMTQGVLPFTGICDRKPFGLFALFSLFAAMPFDAIIASRLGASISVGLTAYMLYRVAELLFEDPDHFIGWATGLAYLVFSLANGGIASNSEVFVNAFTVLGLLLALLAIRDTHRPRHRLMLAAGLVLGIGIQVKPTVLFDMLAFLVGFYLLTTAHFADLGSRLRATAPGLAALAAVAALPTLAVILLYVFTGHWDDWAMANLGAQRGFIDDPEQPIAYESAFWGMLEQAPLWIGALVAATFSRRLGRGAGEMRAVRFLLVWSAFILLLQFFLRIAADHYFLQFLPPFCLLNGFLVGRGVLANLPSQNTRTGVLVAISALAFFGVSKSQLANAVHVLQDRLVRGEAWAADTPRQVAADLKGVLRPGDAIYEIGFLPIVYHLTGARIPTRFAFTGLPHVRYAGRDGCPWVPQEVEMKRVLDTRPRFIVIEQGVFYAELKPAVNAILQERLTRDYVLRWRYDMHWIHRLYPFERFVLNAAAGAEVYELKQ